jgi:hypothetical protein
LGSDSSTSITQVHHLYIYNNLFDNINSVTWGGTGYAVYVHKGSNISGSTYFPTYVIIDHNTFIADDTFFQIDDDDPPVPVPAVGWVVTNNIARYGLSGVRNTQSFTNQEDALNTNFPGIVFQKNVINGGASGSGFGAYSSQNFFPSGANYSSMSFTSYSGSYPVPPTPLQAVHNLSLSGASPFKNVGTDGLDPGVNFAALEAQIGIDLTP